MPAIRTKDAGSASDDDTYLPTRQSRYSRQKRNRPENRRASFPSPVTDEDALGSLRTRSGRLSLPNSRLSPSSTSSTLVSEASSGGSTEVAKKTSSTKVALPEPITICGITLRPTIAFDTFWRVAAERKAIDDRRRAGQPAPWTDDKILRDYFFCNTYRVLDKGCQYLIKEVIEEGSQDPVEVVFRVILFNLFTKIETWELLDRALGPLTWETYDREKYRKVLSRALGQGLALYTGAYIKPAPHFGFDLNYINHLCLLETLMENMLPSRLLAAQYMANVYEYLVSFPSMGPFSTYQLMLCLSYTNVLNFHENDFVISGPGSISGLNKIFGKSMQQGRSTIPGFDEEVMRYMADNQDYHFKRLGLEFSGLGPERLPMGVADIEHTLCEVDKYCRVAHPQLKGKRTNIHRTFEFSTAKRHAPAILPKAWSHPARREPRMRPDKTLVVDKRYEVSHISDHRDTPEGRQFFVFWIGYPPSDATWEYESSLLEDAPATIAEYFAKTTKRC
ncbi:hypothetical protein BDZ97DRAFT_52967 [Flammula alnicola]|nr:hypothetical protein BDZ97DRAFT_52967 [Flammula alnicola]